MNYTSHTIHFMLPGPFKGDSVEPGTGFPLTLGGKVVGRGVVTESKGGVITAEVHIQEDKSIGSIISVGYDGFSLEGVDINRVEC